MIAEISKELAKTSVDMAQDSTKLEVGQARIETETKQKRLAVSGSCTGPWTSATKAGNSELFVLCAKRVGFSNKQSVSTNSGGVDALVLSTTTRGTRENGRIHGRTA